MGQPNYPASGGSNSGSGFAYKPQTNTSITTSASLPSGSNDVYNFGQDLGNSSVFLGTQKTYGVNGPDALKAGGSNKPASSTSPVVKSANSFMQTWANSSVTDPKFFAQYQMQLFASGFYGNSPPRWGVYTTTDAAAMKKALQSYSGIVNPNDPNPVTFADYLDHAMGQVNANGGFGGGGGATRAPLTISYTDPAELHETLQTAAQSDLGRNLGPKELALFVKVFHGKEASAQRAAYNGASSATNPEATGESQDYVAANNTKEAGERSTATYLDSINQLLGVK